MACAPPTGVDPTVVADHEQVELIGLARYRAYRRTHREEPADITPVVIQPRPVAACRPPTGVHPPIVADHEQIELIRVAGNHTHRGADGENAAKQPPVIVHARPVIKHGDYSVKYAL